MRGIYHAKPKLNALSGPNEGCFKHCINNDHNYRTGTQVVPGYIIHYSVLSPWVM